VKNGTETDVDCGGTSCSKCVNGDACSVAGDCQSGVCKSGLCQAPSCGDGIQNQNETDVDCGGICGGTCPANANCLVDADCVSRVCQAGLCGAKPPCNASGEFEDITTGECYRIGTTAVTWSAALADCAAWGGSLAGISSQAEQDFLFAHKSNNNCWIGFNDIQNEGTFVWVNGETSSYTHWLAGEPNNNGGNEDCGQFAGGYAKPPSTVGFWNDANCSGTACYYCER
jgi:hypothetical protein